MQKKVEKLINNEMELWQHYHKNYNNLAENILANILAYYKKDDRDEVIKRIEETLDNVLQHPISGEMMYDTIKGDLESFDKINDESEIALRTLEWVKQISEEKEKETIDN